MMTAPPRENTVGAVRHPEHLRWPNDNDSRQLIDDPIANGIANGDATFGWEGDPRYCLYVNYTLRQWELWRLEADNVYRPSVAVPGTLKGVEAVAWLIKWIVDHDGRRGFNPAEFVIEQSIRTQKERDRQMSARHEEIADRLHHGLLKDVGAVEAGVTRRLYPSAAPDSTKESTTNDSISTVL